MVHVPFRHFSSISLDHRPYFVVLPFLLHFFEEFFSNPTLMTQPQVDYSTLFYV